MRCVEIDPECAAYTAAACPMVAGQRDHYRSSPHVLSPHMLPSADAETRRGTPAERWYAVWLTRYDVIALYGRPAASNLHSTTARSPDRRWVDPPSLNADTWQQLHYEKEPRMPPSEAVIFIVSKHTPTSRRRVLWRVSVDDAKKICSDPRTSGPHYMLCYATTCIEDPTVNIYVADNGHHDQVLRDHNIRVIESRSSNHVTAQR